MAKHVRDLVKFSGYTNSMLDFFETNHSDAHEWVKHARSIVVYFDATSEHRQTYKRMCAMFGITLAVYVSEYRNANDMAIEFELIRQHKKLKARLAKALPGILAMPKAIQARTLHDVMGNLVASLTPKAKGVASVGLPLNQRLSDWQDREGKYKVWVPANDRDLLRISAAQGHCAGRKAMGYGDKVRSGRCNIVVVYQNTIGDGVCVEFTPIGIVQAEGKGRRPLTTEEYNVLVAYINQESVAKRA